MFQHLVWNRVNNDALILIRLPLPITAKKDGAAYFPIRNHIGPKEVLLDLRRIGQGVPNGRRRCVNLNVYLGLV